MMDARITRVETAIEAMRRGQIVIMVDDEDRENEGDLCMAAQFCDARSDQFDGQRSPRVDLCDVDSRALS